MVVLLIVLILTVTLAFLVWAPRLFVGKSTNLSAADRVKAQNDLRVWVTQLLAGAALILGLFYTAQTLRATQSSLELNRQSRDTDQFSKGVDQLGQQGLEKMDVRAGGIYTLGLLAEQSRASAPEMRRTIFRILESFIFQHDAMVYIPEPRQNRGTPGGPILDSDFQAVLSVLTKHAPNPGDDPLQLAELYLGGADLRNAHLEGANFSSSNLESADFRGASLNGTDLRGACLLFARFDPGQLETAKTDQTTSTDTSGKACGRAAGEYSGRSVPSETTSSPPGPGG